MSLDTPTLFVIAVFVCAVAGFLLLLSWLQNRTVRGMAFWASALIIGSIGVALIAARGDISDTWSIAIANAILATAYGMVWASVRNFDGRATSALGHSVEIAAHGLAGTAIAASPDLSQALGAAMRYRSLRGRAVEFGLRYDACFLVLRVHELLISET
jgi:hypothetical protein